MSYVQTSTLAQSVLMICRECPMPAFQNAYIRAARQFCRRSRWLRSTLIGSTVAPVAGVGTPGYNLGSDTYSEVIGVSAVRIAETATNRYPLDPQPPSDWDPDDAFDTPKVYAYVPQAQLFVHPTPDAVYELTIGLILQPKRDALAIDDTLLVKWEEALVSGTLEILLGTPRVAWSDMRRALLERQKFEAAIHSAASDMHAGYNAGALPSGALGPHSPTARTRQQAI